MILDRGTLHSILNVFEKHGRGLNFTAKIPEKACLQFWEMKLSMNDERFCWFYHPRVNKGLLPFSSGSCKIAKKGVASLCLEPALMKSYRHQIHISFNDQVSRFLIAGFPLSVINTVAESLICRSFLKTGAQRDRAACELPKMKSQVVFYFHKLSHNLNKVAARQSATGSFGAREARETVPVHMHWQKAWMPEKAWDGLRKVLHGSTIFHYPTGKCTSGKQNDVLMIG